MNMEAKAPRRAQSPRSIREYYQDPHVRARMLEYCQAGPEGPSSAVFLVGLRGGQSSVPLWDTDGVRVATSAIADVWNAECDVARSLWDRKSLIFLLDLDYQNIDVPEDPFLHPADVFFKLEPVYRSVRRVLGRLGIHTQTIATGRGYHFTGRIPWTDPLIEQLAALMPATPGWWAGVGRRLQQGITATMSIEQARAASGLGLLLEYASHLVLRDAQRASAIPVVFNGTVVGPGLIGRECVSIDFSHVGDPVDVRHFRMAFSTYQFHRLRPDIFGTLASQTPPLVAIPRGRRSLVAFLSAGRGLAAGRRASRRVTTLLPDLSNGIRRLLRSYATSALAVFHRAFYRRAVSPVPPPYGSLDLPPCVTASLNRPNDLMLKPEHIQHVVRVLMSRGYSAGDIAALIRAKYEENHEWGGRWSRLDGGTRAEFDVRVFAGMIATGLDTLVDLNCVSAQEKGLCPGTGCQFDLRRDQDSLRPLRAS